MNSSVFGSQDAVDSFLYACALGNVQYIADHIRSGFLIDAEDSSGNTSLQIASAAGHLNVVELLLRSGASTDKSNSYGWSALHQAACAGHLRVAQILVGHKIPLSAKTKYGQSVLSLAASGGHLKTVQYFLSLDVDWIAIESVDPPGICSLSAALVACAFGHQDVLSVLLGFNDLTAIKPSLTGTTALMFASASGSVVCCQLLIDKGVNVNQTDCAGRSAAACGAMMGQKIMIGSSDLAANDPNVYYYEDDLLGTTDVFEALREDDLELLKRILTASPNLKNKETLDGNRTLLIEAANSKNTKALQLFLSQGAGVNATASKSGRTALSHAVENCFEDGILLLLDAGADPVIKDLTDKCALDYMSHRLCQLSQPVIRKLCLASLSKLAPDMMNFVNESILVPMNIHEAKSGKTLFGKLKKKFSSAKASKTKDHNTCSPADIFSFPSLGTMAFAGNTSTSGHLEMEPVRMEPLSPPFDRRKMIWTDGAHDDSTASVPPMSASLREAETMPPGNTVFTMRNVKRRTSAKTDPKLRLPSTSLLLSSGDESTGDESELKGYLRNVNLGHYEPLLKNNEIRDLATFRLLTDRDLRDLNVGTMDRHSLIQAITRAKNLEK